MFHLTVTATENSATLRLEGVLGRERVAEARRAWTAVSAQEPHRTLRVDVKNLDWFDAHGLALLREMSDSHAQIVPSGRLLRQILQTPSRSRAKTRFLVQRVVAPALAVLLLCFIVLIQRRTVLAESRAPDLPKAVLRVTPQQTQIKPIEKAKRLATARSRQTPASTRGEAPNARAAMVRLPGR